MQCPIDSPCGSSAVCICTTVTAFRQPRLKCRHAQNYHWMSWARPVIAQPCYTQVCMVPIQQKFTGRAHPPSHHFPFGCFTWQNQGRPSTKIDWQRTPQSAALAPGPAHCCMAALYEQPAQPSLRRRRGRLRVLTVAQYAPWLSGRHTRVGRSIHGPSQAMTGHVCVCTLQEDVDQGCQLFSLPGLRTTVWQSDQLGVCQPAGAPVYPLSFCQNDKNGSKTATSGTIGPGLIARE